ncbi:hypothetical protein [Streptomyces murinus]|uniref:hypothetical protein n=1 Tax=Streptomyces murinus TaxID=33900 RepID=UPI001F47CA51|nr:hypothetical protein [Streptomyces murinus]WSI83364.1 hypothetical protein OG516_01985 [Streptomyces murinus]
MGFAEVHREVLQLSPARPGSVLDVGAGSERDRGGRMILSLRHGPVPAGVSWAYLGFEPGV